MSKEYIPIQNNLVWIGRKRQHPRNMTFNNPTQAGHAQLGLTGVYY